MGLFDSLFGSDEPSDTIREPAFDDLYYPDTSEELQVAVQTHLNAGHRMLSERDFTIGVRGLISPHAEYAFAGELMGVGWAAAERQTDAFERVVIVGSSERVPFRGVATSSHDAFRTPLGEVELDAAVIDELLGLEGPEVRAIDVAFDPDPSIEVQLPFLQEALEAPTLVPLLVGDGDSEMMADVIDAATQEETLLVVSANLSEGLTPDEARQRDAQTIEAIEALRGGGIERESSSSRMALRSALEMCERRGWRPECLQSTTSQGKGGAIAERLDEVTGYGAFVFKPEAHP